MASPIFQFYVDGLTSAQSSLILLAGQCFEVEANLQTVAVDPVENGVWIGEGATAFTEQMKLLIAESNRTGAALFKLFRELEAFTMETEDLILALRLRADAGGEVG